MRSATPRHRLMVDKAPGGVEYLAPDHHHTQQHMGDYYTDLAQRRGVQLQRNAGPDPGLSHGTRGEAYVRLYPGTTGVAA